MWWFVYFTGMIMKGVCRHTRMKEGTGTWWICKPFKNGRPWAERCRFDSKHVTTSSSGARPSGFEPAASIQSNWWIHILLRHYCTCGSDHVLGRQHAWRLPFAPFAREVMNQAISINRASLPVGPSWRDRTELSSNAKHITPQPESYWAQLMYSSQ